MGSAKLVYSRRKGLLLVAVSCRGLTPRSQNLVFLTVNLPDIKPDSLKYDLTPSSISFEAKAGRLVVHTAQSPRCVKKES